RAVVADTKRGDAVVAAVRPVHETPRWMNGHFRSGVLSVEFVRHGGDHAALMESAACPVPQIRRDRGIQLVDHEHCTAGRMNRQMSRAGATRCDDYSRLVR